MQRIYKFIFFVYVLNSQFNRSSQGPMSVKIWKIHFTWASIRWNHITCMMSQYEGSFHLRMCNNSKVCGIGTYIGAFAKTSLCCCGWSAFVFPDFKPVMKRLLLLWAVGCQLVTLTASLSSSHDTNLKIVMFTTFTIIRMSTVGMLSMKWLMCMMKSLDNSSNGIAMYFLKWIGQLYIV